MNKTLDKGVLKGPDQCDCPVCHAWKPSYAELCEDCTDYKNCVRERRRREARRRAFG